MFSKIDKSLIKSYSASDTKEHTMDCIVFMQNFLNLKKIYKNIQIVKEYNFINAVAVKLTIDDLLQISYDSNVKYISSQNLVKVQIDKSKNILNVGKFYSEGFFGRGVRVAVIDTGIEPLPDFLMPKQRIVKFVDFVNNNILPYDDNGHGTFVSGVLLGNGLVSNYKYQGIAPLSELISLKALDENGEASSLKILDAMQWVYENCESYKIKVVCMSFGSEPLEMTDPLSAGVESLWRKGIVVVVAGGNSGPKQNTIKSPGINPRVITVGGADVYDNSFEVPSFSSRGPAKGYYKPDIIAPAVDIISNNTQIIDGKAYTKMSGTSVATPMIAGVCALTLNKYPNLRPDQVKSYIIRHGNSGGYGRNTEGFGLFIA